MGLLDILKHALDNEPQSTVEHSGSPNWKQANPLNSTPDYPRASLRPGAWSLGDAAQAQIDNNAYDNQAAEHYQNAVADNAARMYDNPGTPLHPNEYNYPGAPHSNLHPIPQSKANSPYDTRHESYAALKHQIQEADQLARFMANRRWFYPKGHTDDMKRTDDIRELTAEERARLHR